MRSRQEYGKAAVCMSFTLSGPLIRPRYQLTRSKFEQRNDQLALCREVHNLAEATCEAKTYSPSQGIPDRLTCRFSWLYAIQAVRPLVLLDNYPNSIATRPPPGYRGSAVPCRKRAFS
jgi:hypothetical protein